MESFISYTELFKKWKNEKNNSNLTDILKNGPSYFQNLSTNEIGLVLSIFLSDKTGLLHFLSDASNRTMESSFIEGFKLLNFIVKQFHSLLDQYIIGIKKVCQSAIITKSSQYIKIAAADCFESLVTMCPSYKLELHETVQAFVTKFHLCTDTERAKFYRALGSVAKHHPEAISSKDSRTIFDRVMNDFVERYSKSKPGSQPSELAIYIKVLSSLMGNFSPLETPEKFKYYYKKLYTYIKELSTVSMSQQLKFVSREAIALLGKHMPLFSDFVYDDALFWHHTLLKWTKLKGENGVVAFSTLSVYYESMGLILKGRNTESGRKTFERLIQYFEETFTNENVELITLQLSIRGFGHMAGACKNYLTENDVVQMFSLIARRTTVMYANNNETNGSLENVAYYQVALSEILLHMSEVSPDQLTALTSLSLILIKRFPDLSVTSHSLAVTSLTKTIYNIRQTCRRSYEEFVQQLVYEGIIWSCSHALFVDAERECEMENLNQRPVCYQNYLPLWQSLLCRNRMITNVGDFTISVQIFNNIVETCVKLIKKLNLDVKTINMSCEIDTFDMPIAVNDTDFRVFVNLVDLFIAILEKSEPDMMEPNKNWFVHEIITESTHNPLISGFYKLIHVVLKLNNSSCDQSEEILPDETFKLVSKYLSDTIDRLASFSGELQAACFNLIFETPVPMAENMLDQLIPVFKMAFSLGQSNFHTAQSALNTLEKWTKTISGERMKRFLIEVVPSLESFLQSKESTVELTQEILLNERKVVKNIVLTDHEKTLPEFQRRILLFFGSLNSEVTSNFAAERSCSNGALGDEKNLLKYTLLYKDMKPEIYLDTILLRTIELALESTDRRTRVVACEVLHSIVIIMLGKTMQFLSSNPDHLVPLFKKICPAVLRLGSDSDQVIQQLFHPLAIQLTHWYSSKMMLRSSETTYLIEIMFDFLTYESSVALSDFCGVCLAEFVKWSIKQSTDAELQTSSTNTAAIISKITNFALHPSVQKRIGAAIAFNYLYKILRESDVIVDKFWLELLFCFIKSLDGCNSMRILMSLRHVEGVIENRYELLNNPSPRRRKPTEFKGTLLKDAVDWLLVQCGSLDSNCRSKSMEFLGKISKHVPGFGSLQEVFADYVNRNNVRGLNQIILKDLRSKIETLSVETIKPLFRTLDCYIWILNENIISLDLLFTDKNANKDMIFNCIINFIYLINVKREKNEKSSEILKQHQKLRVLKCQTILRIFDFIKILLNKMERHARSNSSSFVPTFFWNDELYSLISTSIFKPEVIGFDSQNLDILECLTPSLQQLLDTLIQKLDAAHLAQLRESILKETKVESEDFLDFTKIFNGDTSVTFRSYLKGLMMLETSDEFGKLYKRPVNDDDSINKVTQIFNSLKKDQYGSLVSVNLESSEREYLENLVEFLFLKFQPNMVINLVNIVDSKTELTHQNSTSISHGEYFMNLFQIPVFRSLLKNLSKSLDVLLSNSLKDKFDVVVLILKDLLTYVKQNKKCFEEQLSGLEKEFIDRFSTFRSLINWVEKRKEKVINLYALIVQLSQNPSGLCSEPNEFYSWIMQELLGYLDLEHKTRMLNSFLPCILDESEHKNQELIRCVHKLKTDYYPVTMNDLVKGSLGHSNVIASFQTLLRHLSSLKSIALFDCVIYLTVGNVEYLWDDCSTKYLTVYFDKISTDDAQKSLQILYKYFMNTENFKTRLQILNKLLLKCIHLCKANAIEQFFELNIKEIYGAVSQDLSEDGPCLKNLIVSKIGCYNLLEIMFAKVPLEKISGADSKIAKNAIETIETGKELFQALNTNVLGVRKSKSNATEPELMRLLHCAAYNCSIAIVSLKCEERFYVLVFAEDRNKGGLIWENIIDKNRRYEFRQDLKELPKEYKKLINIRKQSNLRQDHIHSHLMSYNLAASTLNEDLACFDLYESNLRPEPTAGNIGEEEIMSLTFECDDLNNHECMAPICGVITHMVSRSIYNLPSDGEDVRMPKWMQCFHSSLNNTMVYNVKFFMIKVIVNMQEAFKPYGKSFLTPTLTFLKMHFRDYRHMSYVIKDILIMLINWQTVAVPSQHPDKQLAQNLLEMLMKDADSHQRHIYKYNVEIINMLVEAWQSCLEVPQGILKITNASPKFVVRMIFTFLSNNKQESIVSRREVLEYLMSLFDNSDGEIVSHVCIALGLILQYLESKNGLQTKQWIVDNIQTSVFDKSDKDHNKYIKCIHDIHSFYPSIISHCFKQLTSKFFKIDEVHKEKCLELFLSAMPNFTEKEIMTELGFIKFQDILINKMLTCQNVALRIIKKLLGILSPFDYLPMAQLIVPYSKDASVTKREIVMDIFTAVYKKYNDNIEDDIAVSQLKSLSRYVLLLGLLDTNESLQNKLLHFWTEDGNIPDKSIERILEIFNMYDTELESDYLPILPLMMLHLVSKDPEFKKKMFEPLSNCKFEDYEVAVSWRSKHTGLAAPMFTSSLVSQMSQYYSQSNPTFSRFNQSLNQSLFLRVSQSLQFKETTSNDQSFFQFPHHAVANKYSNLLGNGEKIPEPSKNKKSKRLLQNTADLRDNIQQKQISINRRRDEMLKEEVDRQRNSIRMYRKYRIGDFPDTEITHSTLIEPLQELVKHDHIIARDLTVAMFCSMVKEMSPNQKNEFFQKLSVSLKLILDKTQGSKPLIATVLEIILNSYEINVVPNTIAKVSKSCGLLSLGALLLEEKMISGHTTENSEPPPKMSKNCGQPYEEGNEWLQLASIYKSMNDFDILQSIFGCEKFGKELQEASFAQAACKWREAKVAYEKAWELNEGLVKDYCEESLFLCLAHLSDWKQMNHHVETEFNSNFDALWLKPMNDNWMVSWVLQAQIHGMVQNNHSDRFLKALNDWVNTKDKLTQLKALHGEELAIFYIDKNPEFSENCLVGGLETIRQEWKDLNPQYYEQKINKYLKLRGLTDIKTYLKAIKDASQLTPNVQSMLSFWNNNVPAKQDDLLLWHKHIDYRLYFIRLLKPRFEDEDSNELNETLDMINTAVVRQCLNIARVAYGQCNLHFMKIYLQYSEPYLKEGDSNLNIEWQLSYSKYKYLCYVDSKTQEKKAKAFTGSWEEAHKLVTNDSSDKKMQMDVRQHIGSLVIELQKLVVNDKPIYRILLEDQVILQQLPPRFGEETILKQLSDYCLTKLKECYDLADSRNKASCYSKVSMYCHSMSGASESSLDLSQEFVHSTLGAMSYSSLEASQYFPCLLHLDYSNNPELRRIFERTSENVETWMFLKWQAQLLSHIETPLCSLIVPILLRLAETYPNSFVYTFRMTKEMNKSLLNHPIVRKLTQILSENKDLELFLEALKYVVQPELYLKYHVSELEANTSIDVTTAVNTLLTTVYPTVRDSERILVRGKIYKVIARFEQSIKDMLHKESGEFSSCKKQIINDLEESLKDRIKGSCKLPLEDYSPWLRTFSGGDIEIPGQYDRDEKPMPQYHTKIVKLHRNVTILPSLRKPIKITMLGNDGKNYNFLVKFGEDLRTDERIEQLFTLMNKILQGDTVCRQRQLSIDTYLVIPLAGSLGLIQWVDNTKSLNEIINLVLTDPQKIERDRIMSSYVSWMSTPPTGQTLEALYNKAILRHGRQEVTTKFNNLKSRLDWDILRKAFKRLSLSPESFFLLRHKFITSYATICIAQWILGIGDRNLSNTLISYTSGKALGIDFGYSFDAAIDSSVPELMPFRLTPQILGLLQPFDENGLLKVTMINVLRAIKRGKDPLLACMDIFIKEPSLDWMSRKRILKNRQEESSDAKWYPKKKINIVMDKINGVKPSKVTLLQMKDRHGSTEYFSKYIDVVNGSDNGLQSRVRSERRDENLSIEEQVECLLDQATDPNILGRTWYSWEPWI